MISLGAGDCVYAIIEPSGMPPYIIYSQYSIAAYVRTDDAAYKVMFAELVGWAKQGHVIKYRHREARAAYYSGEDLAMMAGTAEEIENRLAVTMQPVTKVFIYQAGNLAHEVLIAEAHAAEGVTAR